MDALLHARRNTSFRHYRDGYAPVCESTVKLAVAGTPELTVAKGNGVVNALDLRQVHLGHRRRLGQHHRSQLARADGRHRLISTRQEIWGVDVSSTRPMGSERKPLAPRFHDTSREQNAHAPHGGWDFGPPANETRKNCLFRRFVPFTLASQTGVSALLISAPRP